MSIRQGARDVARVSHVINVFFRHGLGHVVDELDLMHHIGFFQKLLRGKGKVPDKPEVHLRKAFEELGGAYIKLGQLLSIRPDLVPASYAEELSKLQDRVPGFKEEIARHIIEQELKKPLKDVFRSFDFTPLSSASIGQVHKAILKDGRHVVVKVQRPRIRGMFEADLDAMRFIATRLAKNPRFRDINPENIIDEFEYYTKNELDFRKEAQYMQMFHDNFAGSKTVVIPQVYKDLCTERVLVMEFIEGIKIRDLPKSGKKHDRKRIIRNGIGAMMSMMFDHSVFHADLHPGNLLVLPGDRIALLDFGIVGVMDEKLRKESIRMILALATKDFGSVADILWKVGKPSERTNKEDFRREVSFIISEWYGKSLREERATHMMRKLFELCVHQGLVMPRDLVLLGKAAVTLEGTCQLLDPEFDFSKEAIPFLKSLVKEEVVPKNILAKLLRSSIEFRDSMIAFPQKLSSIMDTLGEGRLKVDLNAQEVKSLTDEIGHSSTRLSVGIILAALIISGTITATTSLPPLILGYPAITLISYISAGILGVYFFLTRP